jgi:hypothetical protein
VALNGELYLTDAYDVYRFIGDPCLAHPDELFPATDCLTNCPAQHVVHPSPTSGSGFLSP